MLLSRERLFHAALLALLTAASATAGDGDPIPAGEPGGPGLAVRATKILTCAREGPQVVDHGVLLVRDGKIEAVGTTREVEVPDGYELLDVGRHWVMPGCVELHNHIGPTSIFTNDINDTVYLTNPGLRASAGVNPNNRLMQWGVAGGVTSALFIPGSGSNMGGQGVLYKLGHETYEQSEIRNPGSLKLAQAGNPEGWTVGVGRSFMNWNTRNTFRRGLAYAQRWKEYEENDDDGKPEKDIQLEIFRPLAKREAQVSTHTQFYQVVLMTVTMVRQELGLDVFIDHGSFDGYRVGGLAGAAGVQAILGPRQIATTLRINHPLIGEFGMDTDGKILGMAAEYQRDGHTVIGFNTDCVDNGSLGITPPQEELPLQAAMALRYGMKNPNLESLRGLTIVPAETVGLGDRIGSLEPGKDADFLVITGDLADPRTSVETVYTDGKVVYDAKVRRRF